MKSTDGLYVLRFPVDFMFELSIDRGNLKNIRSWKRHIYRCEELGLSPENSLPLYAPAKKLQYGRHIKISKCISREEWNINFYRL
jgi:hypothetical protein